jgi:cytoskeletal protein CcmA (bactofilin family)
MNPVPRERLPYPDLPVQTPERDRPERTIRSQQQPQVAPRTVISREANFNGNFRSDTDLLVEGTFEGEIDCKGTVIVAEGANISATVRARNAVVAGSANGDFSCDERLTIQATGEMRGKAQAATLVVEEGAFFEGEFKMGAGGFSSVSSSFSSWQGGRSNRSDSSRTTPPPRREEQESQTDASNIDNGKVDQSE